MEAGRGGLLPLPPSSSSSSSFQPARKEWRAVAEQSVRNRPNEELERSKLVQSDERTIYEVQQESGPFDVDFCSITIGQSVDDDLLQQRLRSVSGQREELQQMEVELRAQIMARSEIMEMRNNIDAQVKEHGNAVAELKEKLQEREQTIHELELKLEEKDRELRAIKIDNEAAWAKDDLLREQNKELVTFRRERDNSEAERAQYLKQIHDLDEHIQEKERQFLDLEEQHRVAQETILFKDEQLRDAHTWVARVQEMDHSIQAEFRERTEHFNQFYLVWQRQFADVERHHLQVIQQLQVELAETRERSGMYTDESHMVHADSKVASSFEHNKGGQFNVNEGGTLSGISEILPNGNMENVSSYVSAGNSSSKTEHTPVVPVVPSPLLGMGAYLPPGQVTTLHPFVMHQQGVPHSVPQSQVGHFQPIPAISSHELWQNQQALSESLQIPNQNQYLPSQTEQNLLNSRTQYDYELSENVQVIRSNYVDVHINPNQEQPGPVITTSSEEAKILETNDKRYLVTQQLQPHLQESSSKFHEALKMDSLERISESKGQDGNMVNVTNHLQEGQGLTMEQSSLSATLTNQVDFSEPTDVIASGMLLPELSVSTRRISNSPTPGKILEPTLLDERSLLSCIVRAIPAGSGGRIRISSTLSNRLGKMLSPLHWHDYKKTYGKLDDFVAGHPELFIIEGDLIQLREGAQEIISASSAMAKVVAAAAVSAPYSSLLPSVAVTPMAQNHRLKKVPSIDSKSMKIGVTEPNGVCYNIVEGLSNVKILSKPKDSLEPNGLQSDIRSSRSSLDMAVGNGANSDRTGLAAFQNKGSSNGRHGASFGGKQQGRATGAVLTSRR